MVTDRHTDTHKPTPVKTYSLAFAGIVTIIVIIMAMHYPNIRGNNSTA